MNHGLSLVSTSTFTLTCSSRAGATNPARRVTVLNHEPGTTNQERNAMDQEPETMNHGLSSASASTSTSTCSLLGLRQFTTFAEGLEQLIKAEL